MSENKINPNDSDNRKVAIQVMGSRDRLKGRKSNYTLVVPFDCLNQTLGQISRTGGKIVDITIQSSSLPAPNINQKTELPTIAPPLPEIPQPTSTKDAKETVANFAQKSSEQKTVTFEEPVENIEKKDVSSRKIKSQKTRLMSRKKLIRNSSKGHSLKARRKTKTYLQ